MNLYTSSAESLSLLRAEKKYERTLLAGYGRYRLRYYIIIQLTPHWGLFSDRLHQVLYAHVTYLA
jgi:hypothetical protein